MLNFIRHSNWVIWWFLTTALLSILTYIYLKLFPHIKRSKPMIPVITPNKIYPNLKEYYKDYFRRIIKRWIKIFKKER